MQSQSPSPDEPMVITGERTVPGVASENYWFRRHEVVYDHVIERYLGPLLSTAANPPGLPLRVLEVGCGEGYGTAMLAAAAHCRAGTVLGLDYDTTAVHHASARYPQARFVRANLAHLPIVSASCDLVVSLQVIEHVWDHPQFVAQCLRVLRPGGQLLISTPNRLTFSPGYDAATPPRNPYHTFEFVAQELRGLLTAAGCASVSIYGLFAGDRLAELDRRHRGFTDAQLHSAPDDWPPELAADVAAVTASDFYISDRTGGDVATSLDLIASAIRPV